MRSFIRWLCAYLSLSAPNAWANIGLDRSRRRRHHHSHTMNMAQGFKWQWQSEKQRKIARKRCLSIPCSICCKQQQRNIDNMLIN